MGSTCSLVPATAVLVCSANCDNVEVDTRCALYLNRRYKMQFRSGPISMYLTTCTQMQQPKCKSSGSTSPMRAFLYKSGPSPLTKIRVKNTDGNDFSFQKNGPAIRASLFYTISMMNIRYLTLQDLYFCPVQLVFRDSLIWQNLLWD